MKKLIILLLFLLAISGCANFNFQNDEQEITGCPESFLCGSGISGVEMTIENPSEIRGSIFETGERFIPSVTVIDRGQSDSEGEICVSGLDVESFSKYSGCDCTSYYIVVEEEDDYYNQRENLYFPEYGIKSESGDYVMTFINRYNYKTYGILDVCVKKENSDSGCESSGEILKTSSSAPIVISSVQQQIKPLGGNAATLSLRFDLKEKGDGKLANEDSLYSGECVYSSYDEPEIKAKFIFLNEEYDCGTIVLDEGEGIGSCRAEINLEGNEGDYLFSEEKSINGYIELEYIWESTKSVAFSVE